MVYNLLVEDIDDEVVNAPFDRELREAELMLDLYNMLDDETELALAAALLNRGNDRIIAADDIDLHIALVDEFDVEDAWEIALEMGLFKHLDRPLLPGFSFDLNAMSDADCSRQFSFDHNGIPSLIVLCGIPATILVYLHHDRINQVEALCLLLERCFYVKTVEEHFIAVQSASVSSFQDF